MSFLLFSPQVKLLEAVYILDPVKTNVLQFLEQFDQKGHTCLVFEMLDMKKRERDREPLSLNETQPIAHQLKTIWLRSVYHKLMVIH